MEELEKKIKKLIALYESSEAEKKRLECLVAGYEEQLNNDKEEIRKLEKKIKDLQLIDAFRGEGASGGEEKKRVSELIREIDKCIALLNE